MRQRSASSRRSGQRPCERSELTEHLAAKSGGAATAASIGNCRVGPGCREKTPMSATGHSRIEADSTHAGHSVLLFAGQGMLETAIFKSGSLREHLNQVRDALGGA